MTGTSVRVGSTTEIPVGGTLPTVLDGQSILVVHAEDDRFYAIANECSHANVELADGEVEGTSLECPLHGARFDLHTGKPCSMPATEPVATYPVEVRDGDVYVMPSASNVSAASNVSTASNGVNW